KRPNGRFWAGKSVSAAFAEETQLCASAACVKSSISDLEVVLQRRPAIGVRLVEMAAVQREGGGPQAPAALDHEGQRVVELARREFGGARLGEGVGVGAMRHHAVVQRQPARTEAFFL